MELKGDSYVETESNQWNSEKPILVERPQEVQKLAAWDSRGESQRPLKCVAKQLASNGSLCRIVYTGCIDDGVAVNDQK